eukprot:TCONS_00004542-protein
MDESLDETFNERTLEIQSLTRYGHDLLMKGSTVEASEAFLNAYQFAKQENNPYVVRACSFNLGACYVASGQAKVGLKYLEMAMPSVIDDDGLENFSDLWYNIAVARHSMGDIEQASIAYQKAQEGYNRLDSRKLEAECLSKLAVCYHLLRRLSESKTSYYKAHESYERLGDRNNQALCLVSLTGVFSELKDIDGCAKVLDILLDVCQDLEDCSLQAKIYHDIGLLYISEKLYESAAECFEQSLKSMDKELVENSIDKHLKATVLQNLGAVCNYMSSYQKAIDYHQKAIDIFGEISDRSSQTEVFANLAYAFTKTEDYENSIMAFKHAVRSAKDTGNQEAQFLATEGLAAAYFRNGNYDKSVPTYKEALSLIPPSKPGSDKVSYTDRIVSKLSDAMQFQLEIQQKEAESGDSPRRNKNTAFYHKDSVNTMRFFQEKQHSLIAKGLEAHSSDGEEQASSSEDDQSSLSTSVSQKQQQQQQQQKNKQNYNNEGMNFSMKSTLNKSNYYEQPVQDDEQIPRAVKEYYLAQVCRENNAKKEEPAPKEKKESSKMCLIM